MCARIQPGPASWIGPDSAGLAVVPRGAYLGKFRGDLAASRRRRGGLDPAGADVGGIVAEAEPEPGLRELAVVQHGRLELKVEIAAQPADDRFRGGGQVLVADGVTGERTACLLDPGHVPERISEDLVEAAGVPCGVP